MELRRRGVACYHLPLAVVRRRYRNPAGALRFAGKLLRSTWHLGSLMRRERVTLVHSNTVVVWSGALAAAVTRRPHIWQIHELLTAPRPLRRATGWLLLALSRVVVTNSLATHRALFGRWNSARTRIIPNGLALPARTDPEARGRARAEWGVGPQSLVVGTVGRVSARKGQRQLLQAAALVAALLPELHLVIVGDTVPGQESSLNVLREAAARGPLAGRVAFTGFRHDTDDLLRGMDLFVHPAVLPESFGLTILEAMACGTPVIASRLGASSELVVDGVTGLLVPANDIHALADAMVRLLRDETLRERLGRAGRAHAEAHYSLDRYLAGFAALYDQLLPVHVTTRGG
jgi:glycosyltransferase involved in cell wall biosynthesis